MLNFVPFRLSYSIGLLITGLSLSAVSLMKSSFALAACFIAIGKFILIYLLFAQIRLSPQYNSEPFAIVPYIYENIG